MRQQDTGRGPDPGPFSCYPETSTQMTLRIDLSPELEAKLRERAAAAGKDIAAFAREAVEEKLRGRESMAEILGPIRRDFRDVSEEELEGRIQKAIPEARSQKPTRE